MKNRKSKHYLLLLVFVLATFIYGCANENSPLVPTQQDAGIASSSAKPTDPDSLKVQSETDQNTKK